MNANDLTRGDLDLLFEAVEKWESDDLGAEMFMGVLDGLASERSPEAAAQIQKLKHDRDAKRNADKKLRKDRGVLLRAKLIQIRDRMDAEKFAASGGD